MKNKTLLLPPLPYSPLWQSLLPSGSGWEEIWDSMDVAR